MNTDVLASSETTLGLPVAPDFVRVIVDPLEPKNKSRAFVCLPVKTVLESGLGDWLEANVRDQKMGSQIAKGIMRTLELSPENMHPLNRGLTVLAQSFRYDSNTKTLQVTLRDQKRHGVIDGGHTFRAIETVIRNCEVNESEPPNAYVNVEVMSGYDEIAPDIIASRNSVCAVRDSAIYSLEGVFVDLRNSLRRAKIEQLVAFKQNEDKPINVEEVIAIATLFHPRHADGNSHPTRSYSSKADCAENYADEWRHFKNSEPEAWKAGFGKLIDLIPSILEVSERVELELDEAHRRIGGITAVTTGDSDAPREGKSRGRKLKELSGPRKLPIADVTVPAGWPAGYLYPVIAALRPLVDYTGEKAKWKVPDPMTVFKEASNELVKTLLEFAQQFGRKPTAVGKNSVLWKTLYNIVDIAHLRGAR
jgi:hypothetical protein